MLPDWACPSGSSDFAAKKSLAQPAAVEPEIIDAELVKSDLPKPVVSKLKTQGLIVTWLATRTQLFAIQIISR